MGFNDNWCIEFFAPLAKTYNNAKFIKFGWEKNSLTKRFVKPINPGCTVKALTPSAIGCLIDNFHSSGNEPIFEIFESIKLIIKKTISEGMM